MNLDAVGGALRLAVAVLPGAIGKIQWRTARIALPDSCVTLSFCPSQITTHGWFHRSRIHSMYSGMIFSALGLSG